MESTLVSHITHPVISEKGVPVVELSITTGYRVYKKPKRCDSEKKNQTKKTMNQNFDDKMDALNPVHR